MGLSSRAHRNGTVHRGRWRGSASRFQLAGNNCRHHSRRRSSRRRLVSPSTSGYSHRCANSSVMRLLPGRLQLWRLVDPNAQCRFLSSTSPVMRKIAPDSEYRGKSFEKKIKGIDRNIGRKRSDIREGGQKVLNSRLEYKRLKLRSTSVVGRGRAQDGPGKIRRVYAQGELYRLVDCQIDVLKPRRYTSESFQDGPKTTRGHLIDGSTQPARIRRVIYDVKPGVVRYLNSGTARSDATPELPVNGHGAELLPREDYREYSGSALLLSGGSPDVRWFHRTAPYT